jgi:hypothetical protein
MSSTAARLPDPQGRVSPPGAATSAFQEYSEEDLPLGAYAQIVGFYHLAFAIFLVAARGAGRPLPQRIALPDLLLLSLATFKLSRLVTKDLVTSFLRAPFVTYQGPAGQGEVEEKPRGEGMQRALGELLTCPFCLGTWIAAFLAYGLVLSPPLTRLIAGIAATHALADFLQVGFVAVSRSVERLEAEQD